MQLGEDPVGRFSRVALWVAEPGFTRPAVGSGKAVAVVVDPGLHGTRGRHTGVAALQAQRATGAQLMQDAFGEFGGVTGWARHGPFQGVVIAQNNPSAAAGQSGSGLVLHRGCR